MSSEYIGELMQNDRDSREPLAKTKQSPFPVILNEVKNLTGWEGFFGVQRLASA